MALIINHDTLKTAVADWLNRSDMGSAIDIMIDQAEDMLRLDRRVRNLKAQIYTIVQDDQEAPASLRTLDAWSHDGPTYFGEIRMVSSAELSRYKGNYGVTGVPALAAHVDGRFRFAPEPDTGGIFAAQTLTFTSNPSDDQTVTIGSRAYTFKPTPSAAFHVNIGSTQAASIANFVAAINDSGGGNVQTYYTDTTVNTDVTAADNGDGTVTVTAKAIGDQGNVIASTQALGGSGTWAAGTLAGGINPTRQYPTELTYWETLTSLLAGTNWLVEDYPSIYLYATLLQAAPYLRDDPRLGTWGAILNGLLDNLDIRVDDEQFGANLQRTPSRVIGP